MHDLDLGKVRPSEGDPLGRRLVRIGATALVLALGLVGLIRYEIFRPDQPFFPTGPPTPPLSTQGLTIYDEENIYSMTDRLTTCLQPTDPQVFDGLAAAVDGESFSQTIQRVSSNVARLRGLEWKKEPRVKILDREELGELAASFNLSAVDRARIKTDSKILRALGIIEKRLNILKLARNFAKESIAGFYKPQTKTLYATSSKGVIEPFDEITLAHELDHALTDQALGLPRLKSKNPMRDDELSASRAVIEGDATLLQFQYLTTVIPVDERLGVLEEATGTEGGGLDRLPYVFRRTFEFPYTEGVYFVCRQFTRGGWEMVNNLYGNTPSSTAQIIFPERWDLDIDPVEVADPAFPGKGWKRIRRGSIGAVDLLALYQGSHDLEGSDPGTEHEVIRGWSGGEMHVYERGNELAIRLAFIDRQPTSNPLCDTVEAWYEAQFPEAEPLGGEIPHYQDGKTFAALSCEEETVRFALSPDLDAVNALVESR